MFQNRTLVRHDLTGEYERFQYIEIALTGEDQRVVPVVIHLDAGILYRKQQGRQEQQHPAGHSEYTLKQDLRKPAPGLLSLLHHVPEYEVGDQEKDFPEKEEVVYDGIEQHGRNEGPVLPFLHQHVKCDQKEREQKHDIMKMVKQQVFIHEAGKCIHHGSRDGIPLIPHETSDPEVRREPCKCIFQYIQPADNIHERFGRKQQRQPERRISKDIEGHAPDKVGSEVQRPVPDYIARLDRIICVHGKWDLLHIKIPCHGKEAFLTYHFPAKCQQSDHKIDEKRLQRIAI